MIEVYDIEVLKNFQNIRTFYLTNTNHYAIMSISNQRKGSGNDEQNNKSIDYRTVQRDNRNNEKRFYWMQT